MRFFCNSTVDAAMQPDFTGNISTIANRFQSLQFNDDVPINTDCSGLFLMGIPRKWGFHLAIWRTRIENPEADLTVSPLPYDYFYLGS